jgi:HTH-type transcriptional regulator / antitoxin HigA
MKIIRNEEEYDKAIIRIEELIDEDPDENTELSDELEVLSLLIEKYEDEHYPIDMPDPVDAIKFRMDQMGLKNSDLIQYIGSKSKVSEILNHKRKLSLSMIRKLNKGLGISAEVLISDPDKKLPEEIPGLDWSLFPINEMLKNGWIEFNGTLQGAKENAEELIRNFFEDATGNVESNVFFRKSIRSNSIVNEYALSIWHAKVIIEQKNMDSQKKYESNLLKDDFFEDLRKLSIFDEGPLLAQEFLLKFGIKLVVVPHLSKTHIDGAIFFNEDKEPIIALTLRYDRIDYFWFTLFHELAHLALHLDDKNLYFFDDLKVVTDLNEIEMEADQFAENKLIDKKSWKDFYSDNLSNLNVLDFADKYRISSAVVAGRIQKEECDYKVFRKFLGQGKVKALFGV